MAPYDNIDIDLWGSTLVRVLAYIRRQSPESKLAYNHLGHAISLEVFITIHNKNQNIPASEILTHLPEADEFTTCQQLQDIQFQFP